jgi:16S rRNA C1402 (ribose-2'-O) methylase RsmI
MLKDGSTNPAIDATQKVESLLQEQHRQLEGVKVSINEDIGKIREQVQVMIGEALSKRLTESSKRKQDVLSSDGAETQKNREREKLERQIKELEDSFKE